MPTRAVARHFAQFIAQPLAPFIARPFGRHLAKLLAAGAAVLLCGAALAQSVQYSGRFGPKALLVIDGGAPRALAPGDTVNGVTLVSADSAQAVVKIDGKRLTLSMDGAPAAASSASGVPALVLAANSHGQFVADARIGQAVFAVIVDTGATYVSLSRSDADRAGIAYRNAPRQQMWTANGPTAAWRVRLDRVQLGPIEVYGVDAVVHDAPMPYVLLGMSFLSRTDMKRENNQLTLVKRY